MSGRLKVNDPRITAELCQQFYKNENRNPLTGRAIKINGPTHRIYTRKCPGLINLLTEKTDAHNDNYKHINTQSIQK